MYDIETHYQYEYGRGVAELSTMKRAMGGRPKFPTQSPALILNSACGGKAQVKLPGVAESPIGSRYGSCHHPYCSWHVPVPGASQNSSFTHIFLEVHVCAAVVRCCR